jgi:dihydrofolate reductase / thymidylate synthase
MRFSIIVGYTFNNNGIGYKRQLPWRLKNDMIYFKEKTSTVIEDENIEYINSVIMGMTTWNSIVEGNKPLKNRLNIIITRKTIKSNNKFIIYTDWNNLLSAIIDFNNKKYIINNKILKIQTNFIIGGESIYRLALDKLDIETIYTTEIYKETNCDTFFPNIYELVGNNKFKISNCGKFEFDNNIYYRFITYTNIELFEKSCKGWENKEEKLYLENMKEILERGIERDDRTGVGTISKFGIMMKYDLQDTFPISTTKKIFLRGIFEELMLYLRGRTDNKILNDKKINIWNGNTSREFLNKRGLKEYCEGDMGETYGFNFRHFGGEYKGCKETYPSKYGYDQLKNVINLIKNDPTSRRIIINLWNPKTLHKAALPSCLCMYQFYVDTQHKLLNLQIYIRSTDYFLANNWNTCTGALFVHLICALSFIDLKPGELSVVCGDSHIYKTHVSQVRENLKRTTFPFPKLIVNNKKDKITSFEWEDLKLIGYRSHSSLSAPMAV